MPASAPVPGFRLTPPCSLFVRSTSAAFALAAWATWGALLASDPVGAATRGLAPQYSRSQAVGSLGPDPPSGPPPGAHAHGQTWRADEFALVEADIATLQQRMASGTLDSRTLTQAYLDRIAALDDAGPLLAAVIELNPHALAEAAHADAERSAGRVAGALHGIPILLKDNIDATQMVNSAGSLALAAHRPRVDAPLVARLRAAGAVILGKTNLSEWANFRSTRSISGWSARGGQTRNPYVLDRSPCGSSAGTGSAIAASLAAAGVGTETDGSILCPSAVAGLVGIKPTVGLVSRMGIIPISRSQDTAGPMARTVADAATLLTAMVTPPAHADGALPGRPDGVAIDYTRHLSPGALRGARIGVVRDNAVNAQPDVDAAFDRAIAAMRAAGATIVDARIDTAGKWDEAELTVLLHEFKAGLEEYLASSGAPLRTLDALVAFNAAHADAEMPWFGQELFVQAAAKAGLDDRAYQAARTSARRLAGADGIEAALARDRLDALVVPTMGPAWPIDPLNGDHFTGAGYGAAAVAGTPSITVPMGDSHGLPLGMTFMASAWREARLIELAYAYEQRSKARRPPRYLPTLDMDDTADATAGSPAQ